MLDGFLGFLEFLRDVSILGAALMAIYGIDEWRRAHVGKRRIDLAEETLAKFYEVRDAVRAIRSPAGYGYEKKELTQQDGESDDHFAARQELSMIVYRLENSDELFRELAAMRYRFAAAFGQSEAEPFNDILRIRSKIISAIHILPRLRSQSSSKYDDPSFVERVERLDQTIWGGDDDDELNEALENVVSSIENVCRGVIDGEGSLYAVINYRLPNLFLAFRRKRKD